MSYISPNRNKNSNRNSSPRIKTSLISISPKKGSRHSSVEIITKVYKPECSKRHQIIQRELLLKLQNDIFNDNKGAMFETINQAISNSRNWEVEVNKQNVDNSVKNLHKFSVLNHKVEGLEDFVDDI